LRANQGLLRAAGLPVIDSRTVAFEEVFAFAVRGPMVAVGESPSAQPYHALPYVPLAAVASTYRAAGAEVFNIGELLRQRSRKSERKARAVCDGLEVEGEALDCPSWRTSKWQPSLAR
jgi:hypothetical protein